MNTTAMNTNYNSRNYQTPVDAAQEDRRLEAERKEYAHSRNRRPSMLEEAEAFSATNSHRNSTSNDQFLSPEHATAGAQEPSAVQPNKRSTSRSPSRNQEPQLPRIGGHFSAPSHLEAMSEKKKSSVDWKGKIIRNVN